MAITPTGAPLWVRTNDFTTYGGHADKRDYQSQGAVDPTTDVTAAQFSRLVEDVAQLSRVAEFVTLTVQCNDSSPAVPTIVSRNQLAGAPPTGVRNGNGDVTLTFASSYLDAYAVSGAINLTGAIASLHGSTSGDACPELVSAVAVRVRCTGNTSGAGISNARFTLTLWTGP